jgi:hypothetical protein
MKTILHFAAVLAAFTLLHGSANDLLPTAPPTKPHAQEVADAIKEQNLAFIKGVARRVQTNIKACWADPEHTPQEFLNQFGTKAAASLTLNAQAAALVMAYEESTGLVILDRSVLALVGNFTVNNDGTVTVNP